MLGYYQIIRLAREGPRLLADGAAPSVAAPGKPNKIRLLCDGGRRARVAVSVNGKKIASATDRRGIGRFENIGVLVVSQKGGASITFDDVSARMG